MKISYLNFLFIGLLLIVSGGAYAQNFWAKGMGGTGFDLGYAIALDASGNLYTTGYFRESVDFDPDSGAMLLVSNGSEDIYLAKYNPSGSLIWAKNIGSTGTDIGNRLILDNSGNVYVTGLFQNSVDFNPDPSGSDVLSSSGIANVFIAKYDSAGNYIWAAGIGSTTSVYINDILVDGLGSIYIAGEHRGATDFDTGPGSATLSATGNSLDLFLARYDAQGNYSWAKSIGGNGSDVAYGIEQDQVGNIYVTGQFGLVVDFDPGVGISNLSSAGIDVFLAKYDAQGDYLWAKSLVGTGPNSNIARDIVLDLNGNIYITGLFNDTVDFNPDSGISDLMISVGGSDIFFAKYDAQGNYLWAKSVGSNLADQSNVIALDIQGSIYITGYFNGTADFNPGAGVANLISNIASGAFLAKYDSQGNYLWANGLSGTGGISGSAFSIGFSDDIYMVGSFRETIDFDPGPRVELLEAVGNADIYLAKYKVHDKDVGCIINEPVLPLPVTGQTSIVSLLIYNDGVDSLTSAEVGYMLDNQPPIIASWNGLLYRGETDTFTFNVPITIPNQGFTLKVWARNPNGSGPDLNPANDTMVKYFCLAMAGDYTVGGISADFNSLADAMTALACAGLGAPVRLLLASGQYNGSYKFGFIPGANLHGLTITSQTGNANDIVFGGNTSGASFTFKGASNIHIDKISFLDTLPPTDIRDAINIEDCFKIKITNCVFKGETASISDNNRLITVQGNSDSVTISSNQFKDGYYGVFGTGDGIRSNIHIVDNTFTDIYLTPIYLQGESTSIHSDRITIDQNHIDNQNMTVVGNGHGINLTHATRFTISNNTISGLFGQAGLFLSNFSGDTLQPINFIFNNSVDVSLTHTAPHAIRFASSATGGLDYAEVYHNSFKIQVTSSATTQNGAFYLTGGTSSSISVAGLKFKNNSLHVTGTTPANMRSWYVSHPNRTLVMECSNNNYYFPTAVDFARINLPATIYNSLSDWQTAFSLDSNSFQSDPLYTGSELFPSITSPLRNAGKPIAGITHDINGYVRSLTTPAIGAHEFCQIAFVPAAVSICAGSSFTFGTQILSNSGTYNHTFAAGNGGCDSTVNLTLSIITPDSVPQTATICRGTNYTFGGQQLSTAGTYYASFTNTAGCDSVAILTLQVQGDSVQTAVAICAGDSYTFGTQQLTTAGTYNHTFNTSANCDSVVTLTLTLNSILTSSLSAAICPGSSYSFAGQQLTTAGTYRDTLLSLNGCDSVITLTLSVNPAHNNTATASICPGGSYSFGGQTLTTAGTFNHTFQNSFGCDSVVTLTLSLNPIHTITTTASICPGGAYNFGGQTLTTAGTYNHTFQNSFGCDSAVALTLSIDTSLSPTRTINATICHGSSFSFAGQLYTTAGTYTRLISGISCDSLITIQLAVTTVDTAITVNGFTISGQAANASYVWVDCSDWLQVPGSSGNSFTATVDGSYAAIITQNGCTDTSSCYEILGVGIAEPAGLKALQLYPNPSNGIVYLSFELEKTTLIQLKVRDSRGRLVYERQHSETQGSTVLELPLEQLAEGIYTVLLETPQGTAIRKLVKTK